MKPVSELEASYALTVSEAQSATAFLRKCYGVPRAATALGWAAMLWSIYVGIDNHWDRLLVNAPLRDSRDLG